MIKTVIYNARDLGEYSRWLDWTLSVLKPGGALINWENGKGNASVYWYRKLRGRYYADLCMYDSRIEALYRERFVDLHVEYSGGYGWPLAGTKLFPALASLEDQYLPRTADNSFAVGLTGRKGS